jgi:hypothetical protein
MFQLAKIAKGKQETGSLSWWLHHNFADWTRSTIEAFGGTFVVLNSVAGLLEMYGYLRDDRRLL